jgi:hypothetical protein
MQYLPEVRSSVTQYVVTRLPFDHRELRHWSLWLAQKRSGLWAVKEYEASPLLLGKDGSRDWDYESNLEDLVWVRSHHFSLDTAIQLAYREVDKLVVNRLTLTMCIEKWPDYLDWK